MQTPRPCLSLSNRRDPANGGAGAKHGKPRTRSEWTGRGDRWATIPLLNSWLDSVSLGPTVVAGETQTESPSRSGQLTRFCQLFELEEVSSRRKLNRCLLCFVDGDLE